MQFIAVNKLTNLDVIQLSSPDPVFHADRYIVWNLFFYVSEG